MPNNEFISKNKLMMYLADLQLTYSPGWGKTGDGDAKIYEFVKGLSAEIAGWESVQNEPCDDAISRAAALKVADDVEDKWMRGQIDLTYAPMVQGLKELPAVMPVAEPVEYEACEDAVSRIEVRHAICKAVHKNDSDIPCENQTASCLWTGTRVCDYVREIDKLPSVTPAAKGEPNEQG